MGVAAVASATRSFYLGKGLCRREKGGGRQLPAGLTGVGVGVSGGGTCSPLLLFFWYSGRGEGLFHCSEKLLQDTLPTAYCPT